MDISEDLYHLASEEIRELNTLLREYKKQDFPTKLIEAENTLSSITGSLDELQSKKDELNLKLENTNTKIEFEMTHLKPVEDIGNVDDISKELKDLELVRDTQNKECDHNLSELKNIEVSKSDIEGKLKTLDIKDLKKKDNKFNRLDKKFNDSDNKMETINIEITHKKDTLEGIGQLTFDDDCEHCVQNKNTPIVKKADKLQKDIETLQKSFKDLLDKKVKLIDERDSFNVKNDLKEFDTLTKQQIDLEKEWLTRLRFTSRVYKTLGI